MIELSFPGRHRMPFRGAMGTLTCSAGPSLAWELGSTAPNFSRGKAVMTRGCPCSRPKVPRNVVAYYLREAGVKMRGCLCGGTQSLPCLLRGSASPRKAGTIGHGVRNRRGQLDSISHFLQAT